MSVTSRALVSFPGSVVGGDGIQVTKANGIYTIALRAAGLLPSVVGTGGLTTTSISSTVNTVHCDGYWATGEGGDQFLRRVVGTAAHRHQSADGAYWELVNLADADLRQHGVKADGSFNDTSYIQKAIDSGANVLEWPAGTITIDGTGITGVSNQVWKGAGQGATTVKLTANMAQELIFFNAKSGFSIRDMTIDYNNKTPTGNIGMLTFQTCSDFSVSQVSLVHGKKIGIGLTSCTGGAVEDCVISRDAKVGSELNQAIFISTASDMRIQRNKLENWGMLIANMTDSFIDANIFDGFWYGSAIGQGGAGLTDARNIIRNNIVRNGSDQIDSDTVRAAAFELHGTRSVVDGNIIYSNGGSGISQRGQSCILANNIIFNNGLRQLITAEHYAGIEVVYIDATVSAIRTMLTGNLVFVDANTFQHYGLSIAGGSGDPLTPEYLTITGNHFSGGTDAVHGASGRYKTFIGPALEGSATYDPPNIVDATRATTTVTVTGATLGDRVTASFSLDLQGIVLSAYVSSVNTVTAVFDNRTGGAVNLLSGTIHVSVCKATDAAIF